MFTKYISRLRISVFITLLALISISCYFLFVTNEPVYGFPDQGFRRPHITGDIDSKRYKISPCLYPGEKRENAPMRHQQDNGKSYEVINTQSPAIDPCQHTGEHELSDNNYQQWYTANAIENSWVLSYNFEPAYLDGLSLPNQSLPVYPIEKMTGQAFGLRLSANEYGGQTATLAVDATANIRGHHGLPFLGLGVFASRNNQQQPLTMLRTNSDPQNAILQFTTTLSSVTTYRIDSTETFHQHGNTPDHVKAYSGVQLFLFAQWAGENRLISIALDYGNGMEALDSGGFITKKWNWPITGSYYAPGGELAYISAESLKKQCGFDDRHFPAPTKFNAQQGIKKPTEKTYYLNLTKIYRCADKAGAFSENMPDKAPLIGVLWAVEAAATSQPSLYGERVVINLRDMKLELP